MIALPNEIIVRILHFVHNVVDYLSISHTSSLLYQIATDSLVCEPLVRRCLGYEKMLISPYTNLLLVSNTKDLIPYCTNGNFRYIERYQQPLTKLRMMLIECCRYDNLETFVTIRNKMNNRKLNRFIVRKLLRVVCKNNSTKIASVFFDLFTVGDFIQILFKNQNIFQIFLEKAKDDYDFLELLHRIYKFNAFDSFKVLINKMMKTEPNSIKRFIDNIVKGIESREFMIYLFETLPINFFKVKRCDTLSKFLRLGMTDHFIKHYATLSNDKYLDNSLISTSFFCQNQKIIPQLFLKHPSLKISLTSRDVTHIVSLSIFENDNRWHKLVLFISQHFDNMKDHIELIDAMSKKIFLSPKMKGHLCWGAILKQMGSPTCPHCGKSLK